MKKPTTILLLSALLLVGFLNASDQIPARKQSKPIVLIGGTIHTVSGATITNGEILFDNGKIKEIGAQVTHPAGAEIIDLQGKHVYPSLILAQSVLGLVEVGAVRASRDYSEMGDFNSNLRAERAYNPDTEHVPVARANGIGIANVAPTGGLISGTSAVMMMDGWTWEDALLKTSSGIWINWPRAVPFTSRRFSTQSREDQLKAIAENLKKLDDFFTKAAAYNKAIKAGTAIKTDLRLASLAPVLDGKVPLFIRANHVKQIIQAVNWTKRHGFKMVLSGGADAWMVTDILKANNVAVIVRPIHSQPSRRWEAYDAAFTLPNKLREAGVMYCISTPSGDYDTVRDLPFTAGTAVGHGLPQDEGIKAITLYPAQILGIDNRVGSLEVGKDATLIVTTGNPLDIRTQVESMFIQGKAIDLGNRHKTLYHKYRERYIQEGLIK